MARLALLIVAAVLGVALVLVLLFRPSPADQVKSQILALAGAVRVEPSDADPRARALRVQRVFRDTLAADVTVSPDEALLDGAAASPSGALGRDQLVGMAMSAPESLSRLDVLVDDVRVTVDRTEESAVASAIVTLDTTTRDGATQHGRHRLLVGFTRVDGTFRLSSIALRALEAR